MTDAGGRQPQIALGFVCLLFLACFMCFTCLTRLAAGCPIADTLCGCALSHAASRSATSLAPVCAGVVAGADCAKPDTAKADSKDARARSFFKIVFLI